ncbi:MAG: Nramp family divalent metal transporter [Saprospiraceae bacterium]
MRRYFGPSTLVAAAFIGPGTLTTCTLAGVHSSYSLAWALIFSTAATVTLQEMSARLGFVSRSGLGEAVKSQISSKALRILVLGLIICAIFIGNAAYEAGNISGTGLGLELLFGPSSFWPLLTGAIAFVLLLVGRYGWIENFLVGLVILMSTCFLITAFLTQADLIALFKGMIPSIPQEEELILAMSLIGTTVVPYNLFLHASIISKKWTETDSIRDIRLENTVSIILGGFISLLIMMVAASVSENVSSVENALDLAIQLEPLLGSSSNWLMGLGLMAAGLSSSITAALAAAYVIKGIFNIKYERRSKLFKISWAIIIVVGTAIAMTGYNSILLIKFAQMTNALLLPIMAVFLVYVCNVKSLLEDFTNGLLSNSLGILVIILTLLLSAKTIFLIF